VLAPQKEIFYFKPFLLYEVAS